ncbi:MAG: hypothetical protein RLZZ444_3348 [Pseudomonadota bacterium]
MKPTAVITGGGGEIGRAIGRHYAGQGWRVVLVDAAEGVAVAAQEIGAEALRLDLTDEQAVDALTTIGRIDVLVNGVGVWPVTPLDDLTPAKWKRLIDVNLNTAYNSIWACRDGLASAGGAVVSIGSAIGFKGNPDLAFYAAAKAGIVGMTRSLALALGPKGVRVNAVAPGLVATPPMIKMWGEERASAFRSQRALPVDIHVDDVVNAILFLASAQARVITGQTLVIDGGVVLH